MNEVGSIIRSTLLFSSTLSLTPVLIVAKRGAVGDWAAYCAGVSLSDCAEHEPESPIAREVASMGYKLSEAEARAFFPTVEGAYRA